MPGKRAGTTKKPGKKKQKKAKLLAAPNGIAVVSSIEFPRYFRKSFKRRVNDRNVKVKYKHVVGYDDTGLAKLIAEIANFDGDSDIGLIVTAGGLAAYEAAKAYKMSHSNAKNFISLVGAEPDQASQPTNCLGGVNLQSVDANRARIDHLVSKGHTEANIALLYNSNSKMQSMETGTGGWPTTAHQPIAGGNNGGKNDSSKYASDFQNIPSGVTALVISADPFFQDTMDDLIDAANNWVGASGTTRYVCYPVQEYENKDGSPSPTPHKATLLGPDLRGAYNLLGQRAKDAINNRTKQWLLTPDYDTTKEIV